MAPKGAPLSLTRAGIVHEDDGFRFARNGMGLAGSAATATDRHAVRQARPSAFVAARTGSE